MGPRSVVPLNLVSVDETIESLISLSQSSFSHTVISSESPPPPPPNFFLAEMGIKTLSYLVVVF